MTGKQAPPPFPGNWVSRESLPMGLDAAKSLADICYWSNDSKSWETGITSERVNYFVRLPEAPTPYGFEHTVLDWTKQTQGATA